MAEEIFVPAGIEPSREQLAIQLARVRFGLVEANAGPPKTTTPSALIEQVFRCCLDCHIRVRLGRNILLLIQHIAVVPQLGPNSSVE